MTVVRRVNADETSRSSPSSSYCSTDNGSEASSSKRAMDTHPTGRLACRAFMRILVVGAGGVGEAIAAIARRRDFWERMVLADIDAARAQRVVERLGDDRLAAAQLDASDTDAIVALARDQRADLVLNACDPRFNPPIFAAARAAGTNYLDMAMTLSEPDPADPYSKPGVKLGDAQFAEAG